MKDEIPMGLSSAAAPRHFPWPASVFSVPRWFSISFLMFATYGLNLRYHLSLEASHG